jgi:hypothetical protein
MDDDVMPADQGVSINRAVAARALRDRARSRPGKTKEGNR